MEIPEEITGLPWNVRDLIKLAWPAVRHVLSLRRPRYTSEDMRAAEEWGRYQALVLR